MKYEVTYSCGHTDTVQLYGPNKDRERKLEWLKNQLCPDCNKKHLEEERMKKAKLALEEAKVAGLPELTGSEKQIAWALEIRQTILNGLADANHQDDDTIKVRKFVSGIAEAKWWINHRESDFTELLTYVQEHPGRFSVETPAAKAAMEEDTIYPINQQTKEPAEIISMDNRVIILSKKDQLIIDTVKKQGCKWDSDKYRWYHVTGVVNGTAEDRMAEIGNALLNAGVPVIIHDAKIRKNAISGIFEPKHLRWILSGDSDRIRIYWAYMDNDLYKRAKELPYARYKDGSVFVSAKYYNEIRDFAKLYDFKFSDKAEAALAEAAAKDESVTRISPEIVVSSSDAKDGLQDILSSSRDVIADLKDDNE